MTTKPATRHWLESDKETVEFRVQADGTVLVRSIDYSSGHELGRPSEFVALALEDARQKYRRLLDMGFRAC